MVQKWYKNATQMSPSGAPKTVDWEQKGGGNMYNQFTGQWEMGPPQYAQPQRIGVLTVAGEASIANLKMVANDNALALDENENLLYYIRTDGVGAKSIARYRITPEPSPEEKAANQLTGQLQEIMAQMQAMADRMTRMEDTINAKSNYADDAGRSRKRPAERSDADGKDNA